jgi:hypothetical protein
MVSIKLQARELHSRPCHWFHFWVVIGSFKALQESYEEAKFLTGQAPTRISGLKYRWPRDENGLSVGALILVAAVIILLVTSLSHEYIMLVTLLL